MNWRNRWRAGGVAALLAVVLVATGCTKAETGRFSSAGADTDGAASDIRWRNCADEAEELVGAPVTGATIECGTLEVPADWASPSDDASMEIALLRVRDKKQRNRIGSLLVNPGGPGASGRYLAAASPFFFPSQLRERFDIVGFDPRGVGASERIKCGSDQLKDEMIAAEPDPRDQASFDAQAAAALEFSRGCERDKGTSLRLFSTEQTAHDMDAIREAVGDDKLNYLGYSYGTQLGAIYAQLFPRNIRAMVLDGAVDLTQDGVAGSQGQAAGFERAFGNFAAACAARGDQCPVGPDASASFNRILEKVRANPVPGEDGRTATAGHVMFAVVSAMYVQESWRPLEKALRDIEDGDPEGVFTLVDAYTDRDENGKYDNSSDANTTINCVDSEEAITVEQVRALQEEWRTLYPTFGSALAMTMLTCVAWPADAHDPYPVGEAKGAPPIVVVGTTGDPATPYENTEKLATQLGVGVVVTQVGEGHTSYPQGSRCLREAVNKYLIDETVPEANLRCEQ